jgi:hypothetical protein
VLVKDGQLELPADLSLFLEDEGSRNADSQVSLVGIDDVLVRLRTLLMAASPAYLHHESDNNTAVSEAHRQHQLMRALRMRPCSGESIQRWVYMASWQHPYVLSLAHIYIWQVY